MSARAVAAEPMLTVRDLATLWRCSRQHVYDLIADGELSVVLLGPRGTRIAESAVADYIKRHTDRAPRRIFRQRSVAA